MTIFNTNILRDTIEWLNTKEVQKASKSCNKILPQEIILHVLLCLILVIKVVQKGTNNMSGNGKTNFYPVSLIRIYSSDSGEEIE